MNKIKMTIDMKDDCLQFFSFKTHIKAFIKLIQLFFQARKSR